MARSGSVVLVTGASSGIGEALARDWARRGVRLALLARRKDRLDALAAECRVQCVTFECDVTSDEQVERAVNGTLREFGRIDTVVANAGFGVMGTVDRLRIEDFRRQFETNVFGVLRTVKATLEALRSARGRLAIVGSVSGFVAMPGTAAYAMSKFAVRALCDSLHGELAPDGISVTHVVPGFVESEMRLKSRKGELPEGRKDPIPPFLVMPAPKAARQIVDAIEARRPEVVITRTGKVATFVSRHAPGALRGGMRIGGRRMMAQVDRMS
jgi:short-subunit dehydrogenase